MAHQEILSSLKNHQLNQIAPVGFKFRADHLYDRNVWRKIIKMNQFNPQTQWKFIVDLQITELFDQIPVDNWVLEYLCFKNHRDLLKILIQKDSNKIINWNFGLRGACQGGHRDLAQWMIDLGAKWWYDGLRGACEGGHRDMVQWMIDLGATNWDGGLWGACCGGHRDLSQMMIDLGARDWNGGLEGACYGGFKELAQWMIDLGADDWNGGLENACYKEHREMAQWMMDLGATNVNIFKEYFPDHQ